MIKTKTNLALITFGVLLFIVALVGIGTSIFLVFDAATSDSDYGHDDQYFGALILIIASLILAYYVRATNFGMQKSDLQNTIEEKEKLKVLVEISELKKKLNNSDN